MWWQKKILSLCQVTDKYGVELIRVRSSGNISEVYKSYSDTRCIADVISTSKPLKMNLV
jgi:hypothetical protein